MKIILLAVVAAKFTSNSCVENRSQQLFCMQFLFGAAGPNAIETLGIWGPRVTHKVRADKLLNGK